MLDRTQSQHRASCHPLVRVLQPTPEQAACARRVFLGQEKAREVSIELPPSLDSCDQARRAQHKIALHHIHPVPSKLAVTIRFWGVGSAGCRMTAVGCN